MKTLFDQFKKFFTMFVVMGLLYLLVEVTFTAITGSSANRWISLKGNTSLWMLPIGGFLGILLGLLNENKFINKWFNLFWQSFVGMCIIFLVEFISGMIVNKWCGLDIWSYSTLPFNIQGQITFCFIPLWFLICPLAFWLDDNLRVYMFLEGTRTDLKEYYIDLLKPFKYTDPKNGN